MTDNFDSCLAKQQSVIELFSSCTNAEDRYKKLIELGKDIPELEPVKRTSESLVQGCQSTMYLSSVLREGLIHFSAYSEALISAGLASILIRVYSAEEPVTVLKCPPDFLQKLGIQAALTPSRANGLYSMHLRMKQEALKLLTQSL